MVAGSVSGLRTENSIAQTSVSHVSLQGGDGSGGRKSGVMEAVNEGAKNADGNALTIGILPGKDKKELSDCVDVGIVTGMDNARNNINILSSDVVIACGTAAQALRPRLPSH